MSHHPNPSRTLTAALLLLAAAPLCAHGECPAQGRSIVERFLSLDAQGYRLSSDGHSEIWALTSEGATPDDPVTLTSTSAIVSSKPLKDGCLYAIKFQTLGYFTENDKGTAFTIKPSTESQTVRVRCTREDCKISIAFDDFKFGPHPDKAATVAWLTALKSMQNDQQMKTYYSNVINQVRSLN